MKRVFGLLLGLFGIFAVAAPLTSESNPNSHVRSLTRLPVAGEGDAAPVCIVSAARAQKRSTAVATLQSETAASIDRRLSVASRAPEPLWLAKLNQWRRLAGLSLVAENAYLNHGSEKHARYLIVEAPADAGAFRAYDRRIGPGAHLENPVSSAYTTAGAEAAIGGPLAANVIQGADVAWEGRSETGDIDNLVVAPFHRLSLLAPWAQFVGYGSFGEYPKRAAALALRGPLSARRREPIEFPPSNTSISVSALSGSEWPNPIASCAGYERPVGLPITVQTGSHLVLQFFSVRDQTSGQNLEACGFDASGYRNANALQRKRGRELLNAYGAVVLVPRKPLVFGHQYRVSAQTSQGRFEWAFREDATQLELVQAQPPKIRQVAATR